MRGTVPACSERLFWWNVDMGTDLCPEHCLSPQGLLHFQDLHQDPRPHCLSLNPKCLKYRLLTKREKRKDYTYATGWHKRVSHWGHTSIHKSTCPSLLLKLLHCDRWSSFQPLSQVKAVIVKFVMLHLIKDWGCINIHITFLSIPHTKLSCGFKRFGWLLWYFYGAFWPPFIFPVWKSAECLTFLFMFHWR